MLLIGEHRLAKRLQLVSPVHTDPLGENRSEIVADPTCAVDRLDVLFEVESITLEPFFTEIAHDIRHVSSSCRPISFDDDKQVDVALSVRLTARDAPEDDNADELLDVVCLCDRTLDAIDERSNGVVKRRLLDCENWIVLFEMSRIDRDVIPLGCFADFNDLQMVEEVDSSPHRRSGRASHSDEIRNRELGIVRIDEQSEDVIGSADTEHVSVAARLYSNTGSYPSLHDFRWYLITRNGI